MLGTSDAGSRRALPRYHSVLDGKEQANFLKFELLGEKAQDAASRLASCSFCERRCGANRLEGEKGYCGVVEPRITSEFLHLGEEPELVPSYTIFFAGCTFRCVFCQNWDISQNPQAGATIRADTLAKMIERAGGINANWVGGDPAPNIPYILEVLTHLQGNVPQVFNSNMYLTKESMGLLEGTVDVYLTDFKYGNDKCAKRLSDAPNYWGISTRNHTLANAQAELIIRHLVLPGHVECCSIPVLEWIGANLGDTVRVNVMDQYRPEYKAYSHDDISRRPGRREYVDVVERARELDLSLTK